MEKIQIQVVLWCVCDRIRNWQIQMEIQNRNASLILQVVCFWAKLWMTNGPIHCVPPSPRSCFSSQRRSFHHKYHLIANIVLSIDINKTAKTITFPKVGTALLLKFFSNEVEICVISISQFVSLLELGRKIIWGFRNIFKKFCKISISRIPIIWEWLRDISVRFL